MNNDLRLKLGSLILFRNLLQDPVVAALVRYLDVPENDEEGLVEAFAEYCAELAKVRRTLPEHLLDTVKNDENAYVKAILAGEDVSRYDAIVRRELAVLAETARFDREYLPAPLRCHVPPALECGVPDFYASYMEYTDGIREKGFGDFARFSVFSVEEDGSLRGVEPRNVLTPDRMRGYAVQRDKVLSNTKALAEGKQACNVLLYGDAGTGKSSTVKAAAYTYRERGVRLVELPKERLSYLPELLRALAGNPLKFIIFIDDVTFSPSDPEFVLLKNVMDGDAEGLPANTVIYATSNHRHLVDESASERETAVNESDRVQAALTLASRFGLTVTYLRPDREVYREIVCSLADERGLPGDRDALCEKAEAFALRAGGRTPRAARQFVDLLAGGVEI